jgi:hypothetical protein
MTFGDLDGDGDLDLAALPSEGGVWLFVNEGNRRFVREVTPEAEPQDSHHYCTGYKAEARDLDGDGRSELIAVFAGEPGSEAMLLGLLKARCPGRGAIRVWTITPTESMPSSAASSAPASSSSSALRARPLDSEVRGLHRGQKPL